jgi:hypothetical protein
VLVDLALIEQLGEALDVVLCEVDDFLVRKFKLFFEESDEQLCLFFQMVSWNDLCHV